ncbi:uncharacterized protein EI97DRAFT_492480 [Westerdykella ornata]|uniref:Origin recognition complex subunit 4 n=1 Tax=Westerdykella ornata TaxID=318751 RepID=A0A6A6JUV2_WESOR|nr:uncharacterized protein EI97DRAFT_492480 [Westerdykella ornata]KAF2278819.1 hypothetical protein EI97DRAFT_492480 [Westerdykella ornata]
MDDSPRSSKRRKLDTATPKSTEPTSKANASKPSTRKSGRLQAKSDEQLEATESDVPTPGRRSTRNPAITHKSAVRGTPRKNGNEDQDVYDDIESALPPKDDARKPLRAPSPKSTEKKTSKPRRKYGKQVLDPSLPHPFKGMGAKLLHSTPGRSGKENTPPDASASLSTFRSLVNGYKHSAETAAPDELAPDRKYAPTERSKTAHARVQGSRNLERPTGGSTPDDQVSESSPSKRRSGRQSATEGHERPKQDATEDNSAVITSSRSSRRQASVLDSENELGAHPSASPKKRAQRTRRANRADNIGNHDVIGLSDKWQEEEDMENEHAGETQERSSIAGSIIDPTEPSPFNRPKSRMQEGNPATLLQGSLAPGPDVDLLKSIVMERIMAKRAVPVVGLEEEYRTVYQLVEHTVTAGEGNSMLLIGARGSGKTTLVNRVLSEVGKDHSGDYHVVRLNGFIHTDDKIALREIWRQLGREMEIEEDGGVGKNYADTLTTLLALLSHPSETTGELTDQVAKAVIFVMDEFDLFALHPRQTLLYNLFDIAQSRKAPIAVLGLTTRIDVANSLEKRVKSRFSHRYVHLSLAKSFSAFQEICKASLMIHPDQLTIKERAILSSTHGAKTTTAKGKRKSEAEPQGILATWNSNITSLFSSRTFLSTHLAPHYYLSKSVPAALTTFLLPVASLSDPSSSVLASWDNSAQYSLTPPDSKLSLLPSLSTLSLSLLIAAARLDVLHDADTCNFNMAYDEYVSLASKARIQSAAGGASASGAVSKVWGKEVAKREWESLVDLGLLIPVVSGQGLGQGGFAMVKCDVSLEEIGIVAGEKGFERALERWCRQL